MPKLKSAKKQLIKSRHQRLRNRSALSLMRTTIKAVRQAQDQESAQAALARAVSTIDKTAKKGIVHRNTAARYKSRLTRRVASMA